MSSLENAVSIERAWSDLTKVAFATWIRMHALDGKQLGVGRKAMAKLLRVSKSQMDKDIQTLERAGYIKTHPIGGGRPTRIELVRRCALAGRDHFIKLSS